MKINAVIVTLMYNKHELTNHLMNSLHRYEKENIAQIIIVDNHSTEAGSEEELLFWENSDLPVCVLRQEKNYGFTIGANIGLRLATATALDDMPIYLISNDVLIFGKFIEQSAKIMASKKCLVGQHLLLTDTGWNTFDGKTFPYLEGFFLAGLPSTWKDLDYFDPNYAPYDYEDVDLSTTALARGYELVPLNSPFILHAGGGTIGFNREREKITLRNREYFRKKWSR